MNSYTLTFKKKILISFSLIFINLVLVDIGLYFFSKMNSTKRTFINEKFSKIKHFQLNNPKEKDIIFIGSSRTYYHVATNILKKSGLNIYNFGISGAEFEDYPTLIPYVKTENPKEIIVSLTVDRLYGKLYISKYPTLEEIKYYYDIDKVKFLDALKQWTINRHLFLVYSEPIFQKIEASYKKFDVKVPSQSSSENLQSNNTVDYSKLAGCNVFDIKETTATQTTLKCTNGDGVLVGSNEKNSTIEKREFKVFNRQSIKYLQKLIENINPKKVKVSIILEPVLFKNYKYNLDEIKQQFTDVNIIDLTNLNIPEELWTDNYHLNHKGRELYSEYLAKILK